MSNIYKIYREGNYIRLIDIATGELFNGVIKDVFVDKSNVQKNEYSIFNIRDFNESNMLSIGNILNSDGVAYSAEEFETFYTENTGNFNGGGAAPENTTSIVNNYTEDNTGTKYYTSEYINNTVTQLEQDIQTQLIDNTLVNGVTTTSSILATGNIYAIGIGAGIYPNWGGMIIPTNNIGTLSRVNDIYSVSLTPITIPDSKIKPFVNEPYLAESQVNFLGKDWYNTAATVVDEIPGTSSKWVDRLSGYASKLLELDTISNITGAITPNSYVKTDGTFTTLNNAKRTSLIAITGLDEVWASTLWTSSALRNCYYDAAGILISNFTHSGGVLVKLSYPSNAKFIAFSSEGSNNILVEERYIDYKKIYDSVALSAANKLEITANTIKINDFKLTKVIKGFDLSGYYTSTGAFVASGTFHNTGKIYINSEETIFYTGILSGGSGTGAHYYDSSNIFISKYSLNTIVSDRELLPPANASYVIISKGTINDIAVYIKPKRLLTIESLPTLINTVNALDKNELPKNLRGFNLGKNFEKRTAAMVQNNYGILMAGQSNMTNLIPYAELATNSVPTTLVRTNTWNGTAFESYSLPANSGWGVWWSILHRLDSYLAKPINYYRKAHSGSSLAVAWDITTNNLNDISNQLASNLISIKAANPNINFKSVVWVQGESDNTAEFSAKYGENLAQFVGFVRGLLDNPLLHFTIVGQHPLQGGYSLGVRNAQLEFCANDGKATFVSPDALTFTSLDGTHYNGAYCESLAPLIFNVIKDL